MAHIINGNSSLEVWKDACQFIKANNRKYFNLILDINFPCDFKDLESWISDRNPKDFGSSENISDVINTIFPYRYYSPGQNRAVFYDWYKALYLRGKLIRTRQSWGTYFQRLLSFNKHFNSPTGTNQLENAIVALRRANVQRNSIVFHLSSPEIDSSNTRLRGAACWHFGELLCDSQTNTVNFLVVYRNHDYFNKTLGNLIGLSKLLYFLCQESGRNPGRLIIHSANAYYDCSNAVIDNITS